jgi:histone H3/H4
MAADIIIKSRIKDAVKELNVASEVADALNAKVIHLLEEASKRAKANGRRTLQARDL